MPRTVTHVPVIVGHFSYSDKVPKWALAKGFSANCHSLLVHPCLPNNSAH